jgi:hypothetical protein
MSPEVDHDWPSFVDSMAYWGLADRLPEYHLTGNIRIDATNHGFSALPSQIVGQCSNLVELY